MFYVLALPVIAASKSTGILLGVLIFTVLAVLHALYRVGCRKGVSMKVWTLGIVIGVVLFGLFLWWIWPAADFDVKTVDYNMLTRIQEKIWKVAHGGLLAHFMEQLLGSESIAASTVAHNASITTIEYEPETERFVLVEFDDYKHLL